MAVAKLHFSVRPLCRSFISSARMLEESIKAVVEDKRYEQIPDILSSSEGFHRSPNPFSFLSTFPENTSVKIVDEILQSFTTIRPRYRLKLHIPVSFPTVSKAQILSHLLLPFSSVPFDLAAFQYLKLTSYSPLHGLNVGVNPILFQAYCWKCRILDMHLIVALAVT